MKLAKEEKREQAPALQMELSTRWIIPEDSVESRKSLQENFGVRYLQASEKTLGGFLVLLFPVLLFMVLTVFGSSSSLIIGLAVGWGHPEPQLH